MALVKSIDRIPEQRDTRQLPAVFGRLQEKGRTGEGMFPPVLPFSCFAGLKPGRGVLGAERVTSREP